MLRTKKPIPEEPIHAHFSLIILLRSNALSPLFVTTIAASAPGKKSLFGRNSHDGSFGGISRSFTRVHDLMSREIGCSRKSSFGRLPTEIGASTIREEIRRVGSRVLGEHATPSLCPVLGQEKRSTAENK